jgi:hypothetical protein
VVKTLIRMLCTGNLRGQVGLLLATAVLASAARVPPKTAARLPTKTSDLITCDAADDTSTLEFDRGYFAPKEYARFGLILCRGRASAGARDLQVEFSSHGPVSVSFFDVPAAAGVPAADARALSQRLGLAEARDWNGLLDELRANNKLKPIGGGPIPRGGELWTGYVVSLRADGLVKQDDDIVYSAGDMDAEKLMTVPIERSAGQWDKLRESGFSFMTNLLGVMVGAFISYYFFHRQQHVLARQEELKSFREKKREKSDLLAPFFRDIYKDLRTHSDEAAQVILVRTALVKSNIYSMLPLEAMDELDRICDGSGGLRKTRGDRMHDLLRANFHEVMAE